MLLIITNSYDMTTDILVERLQLHDLFRFNVDLFHLYEIHFSSAGFEIADPSGRQLKSADVTRAYWRKPVISNPQVKLTGKEGYIEKEFSYLLREIANWLQERNKFVLVEPFAERRVGKLVQLEVASKYLNVPAYEVSLGGKPRQTQGRTVTKSLSGATLDDRVLYTTEIEMSQLDTQGLWFLQSLVDASHDVTVVVVDGIAFAFSLARDFTSYTLDWREHINDRQHWVPHLLLPEEERGIQLVMAELNLNFARFDFLLDHDGVLHFCELNPNGQFAWLDPEEQTNLMSSILMVLSSQASA